MQIGWLIPHCVWVDRTVNADLGCEANIFIMQSFRALVYFLCESPVKFCHPLDSFPMYESIGSPQIRMVRWTKGFCNSCDSLLIPKIYTELQSTYLVAPQARQHDAQPFVFVKEALIFCVRI